MTRTGEGKTGMDDGRGYVMEGVKKELKRKEKNREEKRGRERKKRRVDRLEENKKKKETEYPGLWKDTQRSCQRFAHRSWDPVLFQPAH